MLISRRMTTLYQCLVCIWAPGALSLTLLWIKSRLASSLHSLSIPTLCSALRLTDITSTMQLLQVVFPFVLLAGALGDISTSKSHVDSPDYSDPVALNISTLLNAPENKILKVHLNRRWGSFPPWSAYDEAWNDAKCKGRKFMAQMSYSDYDAGQALPVPANTVQSPWRFSTYPA
jgi:hypothetical protein